MVGPSFFMIRREYWESLDLLEYVTRVWRGDGRVENVKDDSPELARFKERAHQAFVEAGFPVASIRTWVNVQIPREGEGYDPGYPHVHTNERGLTLVHYIDPGDVPAPLDIIENDAIVETIYPEKDMSVFMPNGMVHGVRKNNGSRNRVAMIATAYRRD